MIQLDQVFNAAKNIPPKVKAKGLEFVASLNGWSEDMKKEETAEVSAVTES